MKKKISILMLAMMPVMLFALLFTSCGSDDEEDPDNPLVGSTFVAYAYHSDATPSVGIEAYDVYFVLKFINEHECEYSARKNSPKGDVIGKTDRYLYILRHPIITFNTSEYNRLDGEFTSKDVFKVYKWGNFGSLEFKKQ